jgi:transcriptional regulator with XRE-family HTH domain
MAGMLRAKTTCRTTDDGMTPFGERVRRLRRERGLLLKDMAAHLGVSNAYLSALERGERGKPTWTLIQGVIQYFNIIWDEADELARLADLSDPRVKIDTSRAGAPATLLANRLAREIGSLTDEEIARILQMLDGALERSRRAAAPSAAEKKSVPAHP